MWFLVRVAGEIAKNYYHFNPVNIIEKCVVYSSIELCIVLLSILCVSQYWTIYVYNLYSVICVVRVILLVKIMLNDLVAKDRLNLHKIVLSDKLEVYEFTLNQLSFMYMIKLILCFIVPLFSNWITTVITYVVNLVLVVIAFDYFQTYRSYILYIVGKSWTSLKSNRELAFFAIVYSLEFMILTVISLF